MMKKYLDTNVFLYAILYADEKAINCKNILMKMATGEIECFTSYLTWDEVTYKIRKLLGNEQAIIYGESFLRLANLKFVDVDRRVISEAQKIINSLKFASRDSIHLASALLSGCDLFVTDDSDFDSVKNIKIEKI